jgi:aryl-phospho-beta-D-glucosidase BglC (GH1 family)
LFFLFFACDSGELPSTASDSDDCLLGQKHFLGRGINLGNWLEAPRWSLNYGATSSWSVRIVTNDFDNIAQRGFENIRIPARFSDYLTADGRVEQQFMEKVKWAVNQTIDRKMIAIIDVHHFDGMNENPQKYFPILQQIWEDIALEFRDFDNSKVFFELLNEPHSNLSVELWNKYSEILINQIRKTNPCRPILLGTADWGGFSTLKALKIPNDDNLIITLHYYSPMAFTHQGAEWGNIEQNRQLIGTRWTGTPAEKLAMKHDFEAVANYANARNLRIHIGEFGAYGKFAQYEDRILWTRYIAQLSHHFGFAHSYWEYSSGFGAWNSQTNQWHEELTDALFSTEPIESANFRLGEVNLISDPNFENRASWIYGAWNISDGTTGAADFSFADNQLSVNVTKLPSQTWGIQAILCNLLLEAGKAYLLSFDVSGDEGMMFEASIRPDVDFGSWGSVSVRVPAQNVTAIISAGKTNHTICLAFSFGFVLGQAVISNVSLREIIYTFK